MAATREELALPMATPDRYKSLRVTDLYVSGGLLVGLVIRGPPSLAQQGAEDVQAELRFVPGGRCRARRTCPTGSLVGRDRFPGGAACARDRGHLVALRPDEATVTYAPLSDFVGEARFGFRLTDRAAVSEVFEAVVHVQR